MQDKPLPPRKHGSSNSFSPPSWPASDFGGCGEGTSHAPLELLKERAKVQAWEFIDQTPLSPGLCSGGSTTCQQVVGATIRADLSELIGCGASATTTTGGSVTDKVERTPYNFLLRACCRSVSSSWALAREKPELKRFGSVCVHIWSEVDKLLSETVTLCVAVLLKAPDSISSLKCEELLMYYFDIFTLDLFICCMRFLKKRPGFLCNGAAVLD